jgi:uncharacterized protein YkwD
MMLEAALPAFLASRSGKLRTRQGTSKMPGRLPPSAGLVVPTLIAALAVDAPAATSDPPPCQPGATDPAAIVCEINQIRADAGLAPLRSRPALARAAEAHSHDMVARRYFAHDAPDGDNPADRARRAGYMRGADAWRVGEVLAWSRGGETLTAAATVQLWVGSPKHRRILLSPRYRDAGAGPVPGAPLGDPAVQPATTVTVVLGRRSR